MNRQRVGSCRHTLPPFFQRAGLRTLAKIRDLRRVVGPARPRILAARYSPSYSSTCRVISIFSTHSAGNDCNTARTRAGQFGQHHIGQKQHQILVSRRLDQSQRIGSKLRIKTAPIPDVSA